jgi:hypothetical protein
MKRGLPRVAALDLLSCLVLVFAILALISQPKTPNRPAIITPGVVALVLTWKPGSNDDLDLWVQDPKGNLAWFASREAGTMYLEHDDLGTAISGTYYHSERTVIREVVPGEYIVNVHAYYLHDPGPITATVQLWRTHGTSAPIYSRSFVLSYTGDEVTAFRFTLSASGEVSNINVLPRKLT